MQCSDDIGTGAYAGGRYLARWTLVGGHPRCILPPLALADSAAGAVADAIAINRAVAQMAARAEAVEAAAVLAAQEPPPETMMAPGPGIDDPPLVVPSPARAAWDAAVALLAGAASDGDLQHLLRTRADALLLDDWGQPAEAAWALTLPSLPALDPMTQTADWDGAAWVVRELTEEQVMSWPIQPPPVPAVVSRTQLRLVLAEMAAPMGSGAGTLLDVVDAAVAGSGDRVRQERWAAERMERQSPYLIAMATGLLGLDNDGIDAIFRQAAAT